MDKAITSNPMEAFLIILFFGFYLGLINNSKFLVLRRGLALMGTASFCGGVRHKRYSGQQEIAPSFDSAQDDNYKFQNAINYNRI
ncbi:hypothetical protein [Flavobacterium sp. MEB061]|uniref:hypothetical protein n=1 Tax=Flavobacterium sp. MEB061 TaxID=1587524 RepID=UPI0013F42F53|nr:hypothetical protein [Flavobacterium sp. MEB061]